MQMRKGTTQVDSVIVGSRLDSVGLEDAILNRCLVPFLEEISFRSNGEMRLSVRTIASTLRYY